MERSQLVIDLHAAFGQPGCCLCALAERDQRRYFASLLYEQVNDRTLRSALRTARGFCAAHTQALVDTAGAPFGSAVISYDIVKTLLRQLGHARSQPRERGVSGWWRRWRAGHPLAARLRPQIGCPACAAAHQRSRDVASSLVLDLATSAGQRAYRSSAGVCLPHLLLSLEVEPDAPGIAVLVEHQIAAWEQLREGLAAFIRSHDYRFEQEGLSADQGAVWRDALRMLASTGAGRDEHPSLAPRPGRPPEDPPERG